MQPGPFVDKPLADVPEQRCACCGRWFRPTVVRRRLCRGCFRDANANEQRHRLACGER